MKSIRAISALLATMALAGCMMAPIKPDMDHLDGAIDSRSSKPEEVRVVFFNNSNKLMYGVDNTGRVNITLNGKAVGGPNIGEYIQVQIPRGKHQVGLTHLDLFEFRSSHELDATADPLYVEVKATPTSNDMLVHKSLPTGNYLPKPFTRFEPK